MKTLNVPGWGLVLAACHLAALALTPTAARADQDDKFFRAPEEPPPSGRQYAPDPPMDILHLALDITPDFKRRTISGQATLWFRPKGRPLAELRLDAVDLRVRTVESSETVAGHQETDRALTVTFAEPVPVDREATVTVFYDAEPRRGLHFRTPEMGYPAGDTQLWTQGEAIQARHWYPCFDHPGEKFTSEITCRVPRGMTVLSNGRLMSEEKPAGSELVAVRWLQDKPHVNYLVALVAGYFEKVEDKHRNVPLAFHTPPSQIAQARHSFRDTRHMMEFFEEETGVPYPWAKYDQVCVYDFTASGMENTSLTILTDRTLHTEATENIETSQGLVAHELAHQWFGDLVTCKDWSHIWLNEGFATYYEALYTGHRQDRDTFLYRLHGSAQGIFNQPHDTNAIVRRTYGNPDELFNYLTYPKASWVLHMLRCQLGSDLFRRCVRTFLERHAYGSAVTEDFRRVLEELSGRSHEQFFDQWLYHAHHPELQISYSWDERSKLAKVSVTQNQALSREVLLFEFPLTLRFRSKSGQTNHTVTIRKRAEDFHFPLAETPELVRVDPEYTLLARISFEPPRPMLEAQLLDESDVIGRLLAVEQLGKRKDRETVDKLKDRLNRDPFFGVRLAVSQALASMHTPEAFDALLASTEQPDALVRRQVVHDLAGFYRAETRQFLLRLVETERNPAILAEAIRALGAHAGPGIAEILLRQLQSESYRNRLADAAISALRSQGDPAHLKPLQQTLQEREPAFTSDGFAQGLSALAHLARNETNKDPIRQFLVERVNDPRRTVQLAAIRALGTLRDARAIPVLETFTVALADSPQRQVAEQALARLREETPPATEAGRLRDEVLELQKTSRELRQQLDELRKKMEAIIAPPKAAPR